MKIKRINSDRKNPHKIKRSNSSSKTRQTIESDGRVDQKHIDSDDSPACFKQKEFFYNVLEAFTYPVFIIDAENGETIAANKAAKACKMKGYFPNKCIKRTQMDSSSKSINESTLEKVKKTKKSVHIEYAVHDENDNIIYRELYAYPIFDLQGNVGQVIEYIIDITDRRKAREELVKLSQAVEQSLNIVMITDENSVIEYINPKFTEITGYTSQEVIGQKASTLGELAKEEKNHFWEFLKAEGEWRGEFHNRKKNGEYYWEYASIYSIKNSEGEVTHYIKDGVNISKRKQAEEELMAAKERAEQANRFKSEFLANMSHEIRTPLNSILGFIELLSSNELNKVQKEYFDTIKDSSKVLLGIIDDILDFSKIESGKLEIDNNKFYLKHELEPVVDMFNARADEKNIELLYFIDPLLPEYICGDVLRIKQVLNNLISNAIKFTPEKGKIFVEIKLLEISENVCRIYFSVSDNGIGIPEDKQEIIFSAFFQADSSISRKYGGTGLGLAISSQLVKLMGGELKLESREGMGSNFFFELPFTEFSGADICKRDYNFKNLKCFLYVKDIENKMQLYNIERYLKAFNINVKSFSLIEEINKSSLDFNNIMFIDQSADLRDDIKRIFRVLPEMPVVLIAGRQDKNLVIPAGSKITKVIYKPIYASKIIGAIADIMYHEEGPSYPETFDENSSRALISAEALVAEDNAVNQKLITLMLKEIGINADMANNGLDVLEKFKKRKYDIILMDINMPVMDGIEATTKILEIEKLNEFEHTPIIALTAKTVRGDREMILNSGMDDYLSKPISISKLYGTLYPFLKDAGKNIREVKDMKRTEDGIPQDNNDSYNLAATANELGVGVDFLQNLVGHFIISLENYFAGVYKSLQAGDFDTIYSESHKIKGTAANLRFEKLAKYFLDMELNAKKKNNINYNEILDLAREEFSTIKESFKH